MSHIIGRPDDGLLAVMLGPDADPEQAFIDGSEQGLEEGDGLDDRGPIASRPSAPEDPPSLGRRLQAALGPDHRLHQCEGSRAKRFT